MGIFNFFLQQSLLFPRIFPNIIIHVGMIFLSYLYHIFSYSH